MVDFLVKNAVANSPEVTRSYKLRCNRATSCFGIIGPHIFEDSLSDYENHKTVSYFPESMVLMEIMVERQRHKV